MLERRVRRVRAGARAGRPHRRQRGQPRPPPYRSLAGDVTQILQDLGLLLRGEVVWSKGRGRRRARAPGAPSSARPTRCCATSPSGSSSPARAASTGPLSPAQRERRPGLPHEATISKDEFMEATTDLWELPPESATRVGHPAPVPGRAARAAHPPLHLQGRRRARPVHGVGQHRRGRRCAPTATTSGYDLDADYVARAEQRIAASARRGLATSSPLFKVSLPAARPRTSRSPSPANFQARAVEQGKQAQEIAEALLKDCGFEVKGVDVAMPGGVEINVDRRRPPTATDWAFDVSGAFSSNRAGPQAHRHPLEGARQGLGPARRPQLRHARSCCSPPTSRPRAAPGPRRWRR